MFFVIFGTWLCADEKQAGALLVRDAKGLVLLSSFADSSKDFDSVEGIELYKLQLPGKKTVLNERLFPLFYQKDLYAGDILTIKKEIITFYRENERPVVAVFVPEQDVSSGVLKLIVVEARLGEVKTVGNKYFKSSSLINAINIKPGETINEKVLIQDLNFLNRNPFRTIDIVYAPGKREGTTDIELWCNDRLPYRFYAGTENSGLKQIERDRWYGGINFGNLWGIGHIFSYQYIASFDIKKFQAHTFQYNAPLPWHHILMLYGGLSYQRVKVPYSYAFSHHGHSDQASLRYTIPFRPFGKVLHEMSLGFDYKAVNNNLEYNNYIPIYTHNVQEPQFMLGYGLNYESKHLKTSFAIESFFSPVKFLHDQTLTFYRELRYQAQLKYVYFKTSLINIVKLPKGFSFVSNIIGQVSSGNLLPMEQLGIGGFDTVRGYNYREQNRDDGLILRNEIRTKDLPFFNYFSSSRRHLDEHLLFLAFMDFGIGRDVKRAPGESYRYLWSIGPGLRYTISHYLAAYLDYGIQLHKSSDASNRWQMLHFGVTLSY